MHYTHRYNNSLINSNVFMILLGLYVNTYALLTLAPWPGPSEVLFTLGELYPRQTGQPREDCLGEDLGEGQV